MPCPVGGGHQQYAMGKTGFLRWGYLGYAAVCFLLIMFGVLPLVVAGSFFGKKAGGNFIYRVCSLWSDIWFFLVGIRRQIIFEVPHDLSRNYIFVANHISYLDAAILVNVVRQPTRVLGKIEMARMPVFGFIYRNAIVTVDRSNPENRARSVEILKSVLKQQCSIFLFPEGTFNMTPHPLKDFYDGAFRIAIETQTPLKPILFLDGYDRMHYDSLFSLNPGSCRTVYLEEIPVAGYTLDDLPALKSKVHELMAAKLRAYQASWIRDSNTFDN